MQLLLSEAISRHVRDPSALHSSILLDCIDSMRPFARGPIIPKFTTSLKIDSWPAKQSLPCERHTRESSISPIKPPDQVKLANDFMQSSNNHRPLFITSIHTTSRIPDPAELPCSSMLCDWTSRRGPEMDADHMTFPRRREG